MYCVRFGSPYMEGWCQGMLDAIDKGETGDGVNLFSIVRFLPGPFMPGPRGAALACGWIAYRLPTGRKLWP